MENFIRNTGRMLDRRSFVRGLGRWGMGAAAVAGVLLLPKQASAVDFCNNMGGSCAGQPVGTACVKHPGKTCQPASNGLCHCR
jgi:hypothetical protein